MVKEIFWIDDNIGVIKNIAKSIFPYLWKIKDEEGVKTHVRILGNGIQESPGLSLWEESDEEDLQKYINRIFWQLCRDIDSLDDQEIYAQKQHLIFGNVKIMYKKNENDKMYEEYRKLCDVWQGNPVEEQEGQKKQISENAKKSARAILERMNITEGACVGLDLALLQKDIEKVRDEKKPILSMELYNMIKEKHECFLYSYYVFDNTFINSWKEVYAKLYYDKEQPVIHRRSDMFQKNVSDKLIRDLLSMIDKSYTKGKKNNVGKMEKSN